MKYPPIVSFPVIDDFKVSLSTLSLNELYAIMSVLYRLYGIMCDASDFNKRIPLWQKSQLKHHKILQQRVHEWQRQMDLMYKIPYVKIRSLILFCHANYDIPKVCKTYIREHIALTFNEIAKHQPTGE